MTNKGILLSGGQGTRLRPLTLITNKQLLPINKRPIIDYSVNTLINLGCKDITVILGGEHIQQIVSYLCSSNKGVNFSFVYQQTPLGIAHAIGLCEPYFKNEERFSVVLGDNILSKPFAWKDNGKAQIVLAETPEIHRFGVASIKEDKILQIEEKPIHLREDCNNYAITGHYLYTGKFFEYFKEMQPSARGEYEISAINDRYLQDGLLDYTFVEGEWLDVGTFAAINAAREMVKKSGLEETLK